MDNLDWSGAVRASKGVGSLDETLDLGKHYRNGLFRGLAEQDNLLAGGRSLSRGGAEPGALRRGNLGSSCAFGNSFTAGTPVETEEGQKPIEDIEIGDKVLAEDPETGEQGYFEVVALTNHPTPDILRIRVADDGQDQLTAAVMEITPEHPVYVEGQGWLWAENLSIGDRLRRADGGVAKVLAVERVVLDAPQRVYNLTVRGPHTYFVLEVGVLVHNCLPGFTPEESRYIKDALNNDARNLTDKVVCFDSARCLESVTPIWDDLIPASNTGQFVSKLDGSTFKLAGELENTIQPRQLKSGDFLLYYDQFGGMPVHANRVLAVPQGTPIFLDKWGFDPFTVRNFAGVKTEAGGPLAKILVFRR